METQNPNQKEASTMLGDTLKNSGIKNAERIVKPIDCKKATVDELRKAIKNREPISGIEILITHKKCHADEMAGMHLLQGDLGEKYFPNIKNAGIAFHTEIELQKFDLHGKNGWYRALQGGAMIIGTAGGFFDEHFVRKENPSSAHIIADYLGIFENKKLRQIYAPLLNYIDFEDTNGEKVDKILKTLPENTHADTHALRNNMLATMIKNAWKSIETDEDIQKLFCVVSTFFDYGIKAQKLFVEAKTEALKADVQIISLPALAKSNSGKQKVLVVLKNDNREVASHIINSFRGREQQEIAVFLKINSNSQFFIKPMHGVSLEETIKIIRNTVAKKRGLRLDWQTLAQGEKIKEIPEIFFHTESGIILNGGETQPDTPGLIGAKNGLTLDEVINAIKIGLDPFYFEAKYKKECMNGICSAKNNQYCRLKEYGLQRCHNARKGNKVSN